MVELLRYLEANGFVSYIASGGDRDFMRPVTDEIYGIPPERVIGSSNASSTRRRARRHALLPRRAGRLRRRPRQAGADLEPDRAPADRSPAATRTATSRCSASRAARDGRRCGCSVLHDDAEREFDYVAGAETALERAADEGWTVVSMKDDWATVFADA